MKITEIFNTKYLAVHWKRDLNYFLELLTTDKKNKRWDAMVSAVKAEGTPYTLDLAGAKICRDVMEYITHYNNPVVRFIDTEDEVRNAMLMENERRLTLQYDTVPLPNLTKIEQIPNYLGTLNVGTVYSKGDLPIGVLIRLVVIIQAYRPEIALDLSGDYEQVFMYIASLIDMHNMKCDKVQYAIDGTVFTQDVNPDGTVHIPGIGDLSWDNFVSTYYCIPAEFGTKRLSTDAEWHPVVARCIKELPEYIEHKTTITDYFGKE